ncbi:MAG: alpha/beta fold hydrolase [Gammaproteobacteria bacterium]
MSSISRVVVLLHGIRTRGVWQKQLTPTLSAAGFLPHPLDYGNFGAGALVAPWARRRQVEWLHNELDKIAESTRSERVSVIAHSFGTYMVGEVLRKYPQHRFDKLILTGSILPTDYPWAEKLDDWQVSFVHNEHGSLDPWPNRARMLPSAGASGVHRIQSATQQASG